MGTVLNPSAEVMLRYKQNLRLLNMLTPHRLGFQLKSLWPSPICRVSFKVTVQFI
jgi:hypothetical protein